MKCRGCDTEIPRDYEHRSFAIEQLVFCNRACFAANAERLFRVWVPALRELAVNPKSKEHARSIASQALRSQVPLQLR